MSLESRLGKVPVSSLPTATCLRLEKGTSVKSAIERMRDQKFEVIMVGDALLTPERIRDQILGNPAAWEKPIEEIAEPVQRADSLHAVIQALQNHAFVASAGQVYSRAGVLRFFGSQFNFLNFNQTPETERKVRAREQVHS